MDIIITRNAVNLELLDSVLKNELTKQFLGASFDGAQVTLYLSDDASDAQIALATSIAEAHDPSQLTPRQQEAATRAVRLEALRAQNTSLLDLAVYEAAAPEIQRLAEKVAWLELEFLVHP